MENLLAMETQTEIFEGNIKKTLIKLSLPIFFGMLFDLLYNFADTWFISLIDKSNPAIVAGVGLVFPVYFVLIALNQGFFMGVSTIVAVSSGKGKNDFRKIYASAFWFAVIVSIALICFMKIFDDSIMELLAGKAISEEALNYGKQYMNWIFMGSFFFMVSHAFIGILQGKGKTMNVGIAMLISTIINIILDPIFIFVFDMGVKGAAIATVIAQVAIFVYALWLQFSDKEFNFSNLSFRWIDFSSVKEIFRLGAPQSLGLVALGLSFVFLNWIVSSIGETEMNAYTLVGRVDNILITPILAISYSMSTMLGQNYGKGNKDRMISILKQGTSLTLIIVAVVSIVYMLVAPYIFKSFSDVESVIGLSVKQVRMVTLFIAAGCTLEIFAGAAFQAVKEPIKAFWSTCMRMGVISLPLAFIFVEFFSKQVELVWIAVAIGNIAGGIICYLWASKFYAHKLKFEE